MSAEHTLVHFWWRLIRQLQQVDQGVAVVAVKSEGILLSRHGHLLDVL